MKEKVKKIIVKMKDNEAVYEEQQYDFDEKLNIDYLWFYTDYEEKTPVSLNIRHERGEFTLFNEELFFVYLALKDYFERTEVISLVNKMKIKGDFPE